MTTSIQSQGASPSKAVLHYLVRQPKIKADKTPLIVLLHGIGSNEHDLFSFASQLPDHFLVISARAPFTMGNDSYAWFQVDVSTGKRIINAEQAEKSRNLIIQFIGELKQQYSIDEKQVYLCGFSQGAIMSFSVGLTRPDLVKGIAIMSGRLLDEVKPLIASNDQLQHLKVFISHGNEDPVLNVQYAVESSAFMKSLNIKPTFKTYTAGHGINNAMLLDLLNWLKEAQ